MFSRAQGLHTECGDKRWPPCFGQVRGNCFSCAREDMCPAGRPQGVGRPARGDRGDLLQRCPPAGAGCAPRDAPSRCASWGRGSSQAPDSALLRLVTRRPKGGRQGLCPQPCSCLGSRTPGRAQAGLVLFGSVFQAPLAQPCPARPLLSSWLFLASPGPALSGRERTQATEVLPNAPWPRS